MTKPEYEVLSVILESTFTKNAGQLVISNGIQREVDTADSLLKYLRDSSRCLTDMIMPWRNPSQGIEEVTVHDFAARNLEEGSIEALFSLSLPTVLLGRVERKEIFEQGSWKEFYRKYPKAEGIISLSHVGFNQDMTQALACVGIASDWRRGHGSYFVLNKVMGSWQIGASYRAWIS